MRLRYLIMEYIDGGELFHYVDQRKGLPEDETVYIFRQIVSALLYCHRMHICHRDLKPENILLNQEDLTVKLIDFGMAALQPEGGSLSTPCGSPHYAAPEVVSSKPYDGKQADVWSCGVILYVMLTGTTPYNYSEDGDIRVLFHDIAKARYRMPPDLSLEAKDLIRRIFIPDPRRRITMDGIWDHPLLHKFDKQFGFVGASGTKEAAIGRIPMSADFEIKRIQDIDREILRNMRTLWHSVPEQTLIQKLLSHDINQEKLFYAALIKHREESLESYAGADDMDYSNSDYHHSHTVRATEAPPLPQQAAQRSQSQYSIMNDEHLRPSPSFNDPAPSVSSYDPYRASKDPIVGARGEYVNVTVHRQGSNDVRRTSVHRSRRHPNSLRVEMLKQGPGIRKVSPHSSSSLARSARSRSSMQRSSASKHSMTSSVWPSSPPVIAKMRPSDVHRRGVSFEHLRRTSTTSALASQDTEKTPPTPSLPDTFRERKAARLAHSSAAASSPAAPTGQVVRSKKERQLHETPHIKVRKVRGETPGQHMRNDIRKHSAELEKACEEAFFRSSVGSSLTAQTTFSEKSGPFETPPSSAARNSSALDQLELKLPSRPLPELPKDTPNTYLTRTLEETREKLAAYKTAGDDNTERFEEVMRLIDNIMPSSRTPPDRRISSAPDPKTPDQLGTISEEGDYRSSNDANWHRSVTAPVPRERRPDDKTIRVVPPSSSGVVAPLNVRKRSNGSDSSSRVERQPSVKRSDERLSHKRTHETIGGLEAIEEDTTLPAVPTAVHKKRSWFGLAKTAEEQNPQRSTQSLTTTTHAQDLKQRRSSRVLSKPPPSPLGPGHPTEQTPSVDSSEFPIRKTRFTGPKRGFAKWLGRKATEKQEGVGELRCRQGDAAAIPLTRPSDDTAIIQSLDSLFSGGSPAPSSDDSPPTGPERSWFARFFHIKPASKIICFSVPRGRARTELIILLREWQRHGIHDLEYSRDTNTITARVDKQNALDIKPVTFRIELFVVLEHGRKVGLSIARFVQVKGAASGFKKVIDVVDGVMRGRGWLVEDEEKWRALCEVVGG